MKKLIVVATIAGAALMPAAGMSREPSEACATGEVPPATSPLGVGVRQAGDPYQDPTSIYVCNTGTVAPGAARLRWDASGQTHVIVDGDETNTILGCTDGYMAARVGPDGAHLYRSGDGDFTLGARERSPEDFAAGAVSDCPKPRSR